MTSVLHLKSPLGSGLLFVSLLAPLCRSQSIPAADRTRGDSATLDLLNSTAAEEKKGVTVFYSQSFVDKENKRASYSGSIYGVVKDVEVHDCEIGAEVLIVDLFSGMVGKEPVGPLQDTSSYHIRFTITPELAQGLTVTEARPIQLSRTTHARCEDGSACMFTWLRVQAKRPEIKERATINGLLNFDGMVDHVMFPLSSMEAGNQFISRLRAVADARCR